jgi:hypothetical protein
MLILIIWPEAVSFCGNQAAHRFGATVELHWLHSSRHKQYTGVQHCFVSVMLHVRILAFSYRDSGEVGSVQCCVKFL